MGSTTMLVGIVLVLSLSIIPSSTQQSDACWSKIETCLEEAKNQNFAQPSILLCCPGIQRAVTNDLSCFCSQKDSIISQDGSTFLDSILQTCSVTGTLYTLCPDASPSTPGTTPTTPSTTPSTSPSTTPTTTPNTTPTTPSTTPATTPTTTPSTTTATPSTPATGTSSNGITHKVITILIPSFLFMFMI